MERVWYRPDRDAVLEALGRGERPDLATTQSSGPLDELGALHEELGVFRALDALEVIRTRAGIADRLLRRTLATLPFVNAAPLSAAAACFTLYCCGSRPAPGQRGQEDGVMVTVELVQLRYAMSIGKNQEAQEGRATARGPRRCSTACATRRCPR